MLFVFKNIYLLFILLSYISSSIKSFLYNITKRMLCVIGILFAKTDDYATEQMDSRVM